VLWAVLGDRVVTNPEGQVGLQGREPVSDLEDVVGRGSLGDGGALEVQDGQTGLPVGSPLANSTARVPKRMSVTGVLVSVLVMLFLRAIF
jgi:hypothetical protein